MAIDYGRFNRLVARAQEIADAPGAPPLVVAVYLHATQAPLSRFAAAHGAVDDAITHLNRANLDLSRMLADMVRHSNVALAALAAVYPATRRPAPLKSQPTDTDKRQMLQRLLTLVGHHAGEDWADALLQGDLGTQAAAFLQRLDNVLQASDALQAARNERSDSFQTALKAFYAYKRLIRSTFGPSSRQYHRLHVRTLDSAEHDETPPEQVETPSERAEEQGHGCDADGDGINDACPEGGAGAGSRAKNSASNRRGRRRLRGVLACGHALGLTSPLARPEALGRGVVREAPYQRRVRVRVTGLEEDRPAGRT